MAFTLVPFGLLLMLLLAWVRFVEGRSLASIGLTGGVTGAHKLGSFLRGNAIGLVSILLIVAIIWLAGGLAATAHGRAWSSPTA